MIEETAVAISAISFLNQNFRGTLNEIDGMFKDMIASAREERALKIITKKNEKAKRLGLEGKLKPPSIKISVPLIEAASLEESEDMADLWANLLLNSLRADQPETHPAFIDILKNLLPEEARLLNALYNNDNPTIIQVKCGDKEHIDEVLSKENLKFAERAGLHSREEKQISAWFANLRRLELIESRTDSELKSQTPLPTTPYTKIETYIRVKGMSISLSIFGNTFMKAVTENKA